MTLIGRFFWLVQWEWNLIIFNSSVKDARKDITRQSWVGCGLSVFEINCHVRDGYLGVMLLLKYRSVGM